MLRRTFSLGLPVALVVGCQPAPVTGEYELTGIVSERFESGMMLAPLGGVRVTFRSDTGLTQETTTGTDGRYRMQVSTDVRFGQVRAELDGFDASERSVFFDTASRRVDIDMRRARGSD